MKREEMKEKGSAREKEKCESKAQEHKEGKREKE